MNQPATGQRPARKKYPRVASPAGIAAFAYCDKPDSEGEYADDKYKITLVLPKDTDCAAMRAACLEAVRIEWGMTSLDGIRLPFVDGNTKKSEDFHGKLCITAKSKLQPGIVGTQKNAAGKFVELPSDTIVMSGDRVRVSFNAFPYEQSDKTPVIDGDGRVVMENGQIKMTMTKVRGVTFQLCNVQLLDRGQRKRPPAGRDFDEATAAASAADAAPVPAAHTEDVVKRTVIKEGKPPGLDPKLEGALPQPGDEPPF